MGALATAWRLVQEPDAAERYDITVYQRGWRLGGKGASGRNVDPKLGARIEEHGLHILMGFYDNALHLLKTCYDELGAYPPEIPGSPGCRILPWKRALTPGDDILLGELLPGDRWSVWKIDFPPNAEIPGVDVGSPSMRELFRRALWWLGHLHGRFHDAIAARAPAEPRPPLHPLTRLRAFEELAEAELRGFGADPAWLEALLHDAWKRVTAHLVDDTVRHLFIAFNFVAMNVVGMIRAGLVFLSPDELYAAVQELDGKDYRQWLCDNNVARVPPELSVNAPPVNALYDLVFASGTTFAAGTCLFDTLQMVLSYKGHLYYKMNAGMGDIVFAPLYLYLRQRNVKFRFFHRATGLHLEGTRSIRKISMEEQVPGTEDYAPLVCVKDLPCWPSEPRAELLPAAYQQGRRERGAPYPLESTTPSPFGTPRSLSAGTDFDLVVLGISIGGLPAICGELKAASPAFADMLQAIRTMRTRGVQLWLDTTLEDLGWTRGRSVLGSYARPYNAWSDMTQVLPSETWTEPKTIAYFCDTILESEASDEQAADRVKDDFKRWARDYLPGLFPNFSWDRVVDPDHQQGEKRFDSQYVRANVDPSDHYVLSVKDSTRRRLAPDASGFDNLFLAGDWVRTRLNAGCLEAATMGGLAAGEAILARALG